MFEVEIKNLKTKAKIGISSKERTKFQTLLITCRFKYSIINKKKLDSIEYLKDYSSIIKFLKLFIEKSEFKSLETSLFSFSISTLNSSLSNKLFHFVMSNNSE